VDVLEADLMAVEGASLLESWRDEKQSAWLYRHVSDAESGTPLQLMFLELAAEAERQGVLWADEMAKVGLAPPVFRPSLRARAVVRLLRHFSPATLRPLLAALKVRGLSVYTDTHNHSSERSHRVLSSGHDLRDAVFGLNDRLVSNLSLMFGVAGANADDASVLLAGFAGLLAGSLSMASGEYVSVRAQRDLFDSQIALERAELEQYPEAEAGELATIFQARGMSPEIARQAADALIADPDHALLTLAREELGLEPSGLASPWRAAVASFLAFSLGAAIPLLPFGFASGSAAMFGGAVLASISLLLMGALVAMFSGRGILASGLRMLLIGLGAAGTTWLIGRALGVAIS
jgi:VIT1/CCC1 family predicted Fe2+/Mn2+ transporter